MFLIFVLFLSGILFNSLVLAVAHEGASELAITQLYTSILADVHRLELDAHSLGVSCFSIVAELEASRLGRIKVSLDELELYDGEKPTDLKIPVLLFRYEDILNFTTLPSYEEYDKGYTSNYSSGKLDWESYFLKDTVDFEENKFILNLYDGYNEIDENRIYNGFLDASKEDGNNEAVLPVKESGMYCVYIAPPIHKNIKIMSVPVHFRFSRLYSSNMWYSHYCQTKYIIGVGLLLAAFLIQDTLKFTKDKKSSITNIPIISKAVIFNVLLPLLSFISLEWLSIFIETNCNLTSRKICFFEYFRVTNEWIQPNWKILLRFYVLLFTMGYGVIYYHRGASRTFSKMPKRTKNVARTLFITNIILSNANKVYDKYDAYLMTYPIGFVCTVCSFGSFIFPFVWYFVSFIYYFKTRNIIKKLPPTSTVTEGIDANTRIMKAFKQSSLVIFISPTISGLAWFSSFVRMVVKTFYSAINDISSDLDINEKISSRDSLIKLVKLSHSIMLFSEDSVKSIFEKWPGAIKIYLTIALLYVIWIRNNNALVVEDEKADLKE